MKKIKVLLVGLAAFALAGCDLINSLLPSSGGEDKPSGGGSDTPAKSYDYEPEITGGTQEDKEAILKAINTKPICKQNGVNSIELYPESNPIFKEDDGDGILLTTSQVMGSKTVLLEWAVDESSAYFGGIQDTDSAHKLVEISYKGYGVADGNITWKISKLQCGEAVSVNPSMMTYKATIKNEEYLHENYSIADLYAFADTEKVVSYGGKSYKFPSTFDIVDYEAPAESGKTYSPYFKTNNPDAAEKQYLYVNVTGKVIYLAPDGNWGLLADGDNVLEFYAGSGTALNAKNWPNLAKEYVTISGNMGQYHGNVQLGFITKIKEATPEAKAAIEEPSMAFHVLTEEKLASLRKEGYTADTQALKVDDIHMDGSLREVSGTLVPNSILDKEEAVVADPSKLANNRFSFKLQVGEKQVTIAYDYHSDRDASHGLFNKLKEVLAVGGLMTVRGTARYNGNDSSPFVLEGNNGVWNIVPFEVGHIL